jgi:cytochrome b involved in lipid metabolism
LEYIAALISYKKYAPYSNDYEEDALTKKPNNSGKDILASSPKDMWFFINDYEEDKDA